MVRTVAPLHRPSPSIPLKCPFCDRRTVQNAGPDFYDPNKRYEKMAARLWNHMLEEHYDLMEVDDGTN